MYLLVSGRLVFLRGSDPVDDEDEDDDNDEKHVDTQDIQQISPNISPKMEGCERAL